MHGKPKLDFRKLGRLLKMLWKYYPVLLPVIGVCIIFSSIVSAIPSTFTEKIITSIEAYYESGNWAAAKAEMYSDFSWIRRISSLSMRLRYSPPELVY
jgi:ATP-binding cassette subfamily B protein